MAATRPVATDNATLARALAEVADLLEIDGANPFRIRAYRNAVRTLEVQTVPLARWVEEGRSLTGLQGIGREMASHVEEMVATGTLSLRDELAARIPRGLLGVMRLPGVGPKKARKLWQELGLQSVDDLEAAAKAGRVQALAGFGAKSEAKILAGIADWRRHAERRRLDEADRHVLPLLEYLREGLDAGDGVDAAGGARVEVAGSYRRRCETIGDIDLLAVVPEAKGGRGSGGPAVGEAARRLMERFLAYPQVAEVTMAGDTRGSVRLGGGLQVDLRIVPPESYGAALVYFTGAKEHNVRLRQRGVERGLRISEYGVFRVPEGRQAAAGGEDGERVAGADEASVYDAVGLAWIPPELREDRGEIAAAEAGRLPRLLTVEDLKGDLQMHSTWSDGKATVEEMLVACAERGYEYFALTDHSPALAMVGGLDAAAVRRQWAEIDEVQARHPEIRLLKSLEVDILADGSLDMDDLTLAGLDLVLVSVHSRFDLPPDEQTERILRAVRHPRVDVLAHPLGRRLGRRKPMELDLEAVFQACGEHGVAVELNASPERLDLPDVHLVRARELGLPIVLSTDAHSPRGLATVRYGVEQARRAWLEPRHVLNTLSLGDFLAAIGHREAG